MEIVLDYLVGLEMQSHSSSKTEAKRENTHRRGGNVTTNTEIGMMWPQVKECRQPPGTGKDGFFLRAFRGSMVLLTPDFELRIFRMVGA